MDLRKENEFEDLHLFCLREPHCTALGSRREAQWPEGTGLGLGIPCIIMDGEQADCSQQCPKASSWKEADMQSLEKAQSETRLFLLISPVCSPQSYLPTQGIGGGVQLRNCVQLFVTPWTVVCQAPLSMGLSRQEYWSGPPFPSPRVLPDPGIEPTSPALAGRFFTTEPSEKPISKP